jgi:PAS domain S-box-containing protein
MNGVYLLGYSPLDLTAFGFTVTAVAFVAQLYWFQLLDIVPIARSTVVNHIENGYLVLDTDDRVLDINEAGAELFDRPREDVIGDSVAALFGDYPQVVETFGDERDIREDITLYRDGQRRDYDVEISPVYDGHEQYVGRIVLIRDVTEQRRRRQRRRRTEALERQNEQLDQFASVVKSAADAHGWSVRVTEGTESGARFDFTGVESESLSPDSRDRGDQSGFVFDTTESET